MKLYIAAGRYVGTQVDAKRLDKDFQPEEVPVSKEELITYLNDLMLRVAADYTDFDEVSQGPKPVPAPAPSAPAHLFSGSLTDVEEFIQNADHVSLGRVTENAILRMAELMHKVPKDTVVPQIFDEPEPEPVDEIDPLT